MLVGGLYDYNPMLIPLLGFIAAWAVYGPLRSVILRFLPVARQLFTVCLTRVQQHLAKPTDHASAHGHPSAAASHADAFSCNPQQCTFRRKVIALCFVVVLGGFAYFETYYQSYSCAVSERYMKDNIEVISKTIRGLEDKKITYWLDFATLLTCLREEPMLPWDQDSDLGVVHPGSASGIDLLRSEVESATGFVTYYDPPRNLLQVYASKDSPRQGPHVDIWMYEWHIQHGQKYLAHGDPTMRYKWRDPTHMLPTTWGIWMGMNVSIPAKAHIASRLEYGPSYDRSVLFRADCLHNTVNGRVWY